jgi:nitrile hydratase
MNSVHDMGGMDGLGEIDPGPDPALFHAPWEARVLGLVLASAAWGRWNLDTMRYHREHIPAADYLAFSYYEKWLAALVDLLVRRDLLTAEELASGRPAPDAPVQTPALPASAVAARLALGSPTQRPDGRAAALAVGRTVRARNEHPEGHTRLPRYVRGRTGRITAIHGCHVFPDANAMGLGEQPQALYQVRFEAAELWGRRADPRSAVYLDLWEDHLEPV